MRADTHPSVIYISYNGIVPKTSEYVQPRVKIEISYLSMDESVEEKQLRSLISESVKDIEGITEDFMTVIPTRTFLEKIFLLHEEFQRVKPRNYRMSRHLQPVVFFFHFKPLYGHGFVVVVVGVSVNLLTIESILIGGFVVVDNFHQPDAPPCCFCV